MYKPFHALNGRDILKTMTGIVTLLNTLLLIGCSGNRYLVKSISANIPEKRDTVFARVNLSSAVPNKITTFIWDKYDILTVYKTTDKNREVCEISRRLPYNANDLIMAECWDKGSSLTDRYKVCILKDTSNCIPINYYVSDSMFLKQF